MWVDECCQLLNTYVPPTWLAAHSFWSTSLKSLKNTHMRSLLSKSTESYLQLILVNPGHVIFHNNTNHSQHRTLETRSQIRIIFQSSFPAARSQGAAPPCQSPPGCVGSCAGAASPATLPLLALLPRSLEALLLLLRGHMEAQSPELASVLEARPFLLLLLLHQQAVPAPEPSTTPPPPPVAAPPY